LVLSGGLGHRRRTLDLRMMMEISHKEIAPGAAVVTLAGKIMMGAESEQIVSLVDSLLAQGKRTIVFDVAGVTHIDSTGIGRFISSFNKIMAAGGEMRGSDALKSYKRWAGKAAKAIKSADLRRILTGLLGADRVVSRTNGYVVKGIQVRSALPLAA